MNLELLDPFAADFPEIIEHQLSLPGGEKATSLAFNRRGTLLAVGFNNGKVTIWDFDTRGIAKVLQGHISTITSISWSRNGRRLLTSSTDWKVLLWDVLGSSLPMCTVPCGTMVLSAQLHPSENQCVVCSFMTETPYVVELSANPVMISLPAPKEEDDKKTAGKLNQKTGMMVAAAYTKRGDFIYTGNSRGTISIINRASLQIVQTIKVPGGAGIKSIQFSRNGKYFLVNSNDKMVRVYDKESSVLLREFQDLINRMQWKQACFSSDTDYIIGGSAQKAEHNIYIWNRSDGQLVKILEGPKEGILDLAWHPLRPIIGSVAATSGLVYIWSTNYTENWSAFAPDFKELEENVEYIEREDEFDIVEEQEQKRRQEENEDEEVDIMTVEKISAFSSDEDDE